MYTTVLATSAQELFDQFGLHTEAFLAHLIAFIIIAFIIGAFGIKPVMKQLDERRRRIEEGEAMHERSSRELAEVRQNSERILDEARDAGQAEIERARATAAQLREDLSAKAGAEAKTIIENARSQAARDTEREKEALRGEFARLVALTAEQVTGKILSEADHRAINADAISKL